MPSPLAAPQRIAGGAHLGTHVTGWASVRGLQLPFNASRRVAVKGGAGGGEADARAGMLALAALLLAPLYRVRAFALLDGVVVIPLAHLLAAVGAREVHAVALRRRDEAADLLQPLGGEPALPPPALHGKAVRRLLVGPPKLMAAFVGMDPHLDGRGALGQQLGIENQESWVGRAIVIDLGVDPGRPLPAHELGPLEAEFAEADDLGLAADVGNIFFRTGAGRPLGGQQGEQRRHTDGDRRQATEGPAIAPPEIRPPPQSTPSCPSGRTSRHLRRSHGATQPIICVFLVFLKTRALRPTRGAPARHNVQSSGIP